MGNYKGCIVKVAVFGWIVLILILIISNYALAVSAIHKTAYHDVRKNEIVAVNANVTKIIIKENGDYLVCLSYKYNGQNYTVDKKFDYAPSAQALFRINIHPDDPYEIFGKPGLTPVFVCVGLTFFTFSPVLYLLRISGNTLISAQRGVTGRIMLQDHLIKKYFVNKNFFMYIHDFLFDIGITLLFIFCGIRSVVGILSAAVLILASVVLAMLTYIPINRLQLNKDYTLVDRAALMKMKMTEEEIKKQELELLDNSYFSLYKDGYEQTSFSSLSYELCSEADHVDKKHRLLRSILLHDIIHLALLALIYGGMVMLAL